MKPLLITFPFAGGNMYSYRELLQTLEQTYDIINLEIPRNGKYLLDNMGEISDYIFRNDILPINLNRKYILYGHSMGALVSYLILRKIKEKGLTEPCQLIVSGKSGPSIPKKDKIHNLTSTSFWNNLQQKGGIPEEVFQHEEIKEYFEPIIRADFKAVEEFAYTPSKQPLNIPITVLYGSKEGITQEELHEWKQETSQPVEFIEMEGNHFFIFKHMSEIRSLFAKIATKL